MKLALLLFTIFTALLQAAQPMYCDSKIYDYTVNRAGTTRYCAIVSGNNLLDIFEVQGGNNTYVSTTSFRKANLQHTLVKTTIPVIHKELK